jgi:acyl-CoA-binding protein
MNTNVIQKARDLGAKFEQRHESFEYCPGYWYSNHQAGELHKTKEEAAQEYIDLVHSGIKPF